MNSVNYKTKQGDRWDLLSFRFYGSVKSMNILIDANPTIPMSGVIDINTNLIVPILDDSSDSILTVNVPPWKK